MVSPRQVGLLALLAVVPTTGYAVRGPELFPYVAVVNVVLITAALYVMMSPADEAGSPA